MEKITHEAVNAAILAFKRAKRIKMETEARMAEAQMIIDHFAVEHLTEFCGDRLCLDTGTIFLKAGVAKPLNVSGKPLSRADRTELALALPAPYVKMSCDFSLLYGNENKMVQEILRSRGISIVRENTYLIE